MTWDKARVKAELESGDTSSTLTMVTQCELEVCLCQPLPFLLLCVKVRKRPLADLLRHYHEDTLKKQKAPGNGKGAV